MQHSGLRKLRSEELDHFRMTGWRLWWRGRRQRGGLAGQGPRAVAHRVFEEGVPPLDARLASTPTIALRRLSSRDLTAPAQSHYAAITTHSAAGFPLARRADPPPTPGQATMAHDLILKSTFLHDTSSPRPWIQTQEPLLAARFGFPWTVRPPPGHMCACEGLGRARRKSGARTRAVPGQSVSRSGCGRAGSRAVALSCSRTGARRARRARRTRLGAPAGVGRSGGRSGRQSGRAVGRRAGGADRRALGRSGGGRWARGEPGGRAGA